MECRDVPIVLVDKEKMISVVTNLMGNAIKYSPAGDKIEMTCFSTNGTLFFTVSDSGLGIASHDLDRIFERYYSVSGRQTKKSRDLE